jgi:ecotropic viral integration site 5 protein
MSGLEARCLRYLQVTRNSQADGPVEKEDDRPPTMYRAADFAREAVQVRITPHLLDSFRSEYDSICAEKNAHRAEVEGLRQINSQLSVQVRKLEATLAQVNLEHCDLVKQVVMAKLERFVPQASRRACGPC